MSTSKRNFKKPYEGKVIFTTKRKQTSEEKRAIKRAKYEMIAHLIKKSGSNLPLQDIAAELAYRDFKAGID